MLKKIFYWRDFFWENSRSLKKNNLKLYNSYFNSTLKYLDLCNMFGKKKSLFINDYFHNIQVKKVDKSFTFYTTIIQIIRKNKQVKNINNMVTNNINLNNLHFFLFMSCLNVKFQDKQLFNFIFYNINFIFKFILINDMKKENIRSHKYKYYWFFIKSYSKY